MDPPSYLIIDEDRRSRGMLLRSIQRKLEARVEGFDNILLAEAEAARGDWSGILVDAGLTVIPARETRTRILSGGRMKAGFIAATIREHHLEEAVELLRAGFDGIVTRPFSADLIAQKIRILSAAASRRMENARPPALLLADGNERYRQSLAGLLAGHWNLLEAVTGLDALATWFHRRPAVVILSPSIDGYPADRIIQTIRRAPDPAAIYVTMFEPSEADAEALRDAGAEGALRRTTDQGTLCEQLVRFGILPDPTGSEGA